MTCLAYEPQGRFVATGGRDSKLKIWKTDDGFCFVTFTDHTSSITGITFSPKRQVVLSSSLDGTVRAYDMIRYRNFRVFTSPNPRQFSCVAIDPSGELVAAGSIDTFEIFIWDMQTGRLLDIYEGHEGPVSSLSFSSSQPLLASGSWDKTVKLWDIFSGSKVHKESLVHTADVLCVQFSPDGVQLAVSTLDGNISVWDSMNAIQLGTLEGRFDIMGGRSSEDVRTSKTNPKNKFFTSFCFTADGKCIIAGGNSKYVCIFEVENRILLKKFQISHNKSMEGIVDYLDSRLFNNAKNIITMDEDSDEELNKKTLPGVQTGFYSDHHFGSKDIKTYQVCMSPTGRQWACCSSTGLLVYSLDEQMLFDPYLLDIDITTKNVEKTLREKDYFKALVMSLRLNEDETTRRVYESIPFDQIKLICQQIHPNFLNGLLSFISRYSNGDQGNHHLQFNFTWLQNLFSLHGQYIRQYSSSLLSVMRSIQKMVITQREYLSKMCDSNGFMLQYIQTISKSKTLDIKKNEDNEEQRNTNNTIDAMEGVSATTLPGWY
jgi:periodic tryptophan protein 2